MSGVSVRRTCSSVAHQEDQWPHVLFGRPLPVPQQDRINHKPRFALPEQQVPERLRHEVPAREPDKYSDGVDALAHVRDGVRESWRPMDLSDVIFAFCRDSHLERCSKLTSVVEEVHVEEQEWAANFVIAGNL